MSSEHPFDRQLQESFRDFEPDVRPDWGSFEAKMAEQGGAGSASTSLRSVNRWAMAAAVVAGGLGMWFVQPMMEDVVDEELVGHLESAPKMDVVEGNPALEFMDEPTGFVSDVLDVDAETALAEQGGQETAFAAATEIEKVQGDRRIEDLATEFSEEPKAMEATVATLDDEALLRDLPFDASVREACEGVEVAFELQGLEREMSFLWNFGDGSFSSDPAPKHTFMRPGSYDITLSVRSPGDGFIRTRTIQNMITVLPKPTADFAWVMPEMVAGRKVRVQLQNQTEDASSTQWVVDGESSTTGLVQLEVPGVYPVHLIASNSHGCLDDAKKEVVVGDRHNILAQSRFSPNGDGLYDTFMPQGLEDIRGAWTMVISDQAGNEAFRTTTFEDAWDGTLPNGTVAANRSVYHWTVHCVSEDGTHRVFADRLRVER